MTFVCGSSIPSGRFGIDREVVGVWILNTCGGFWTPVRILNINRMLAEIIIIPAKRRIRPKTFSKLNCFLGETSIWG